MDSLNPYPPASQGCGALATNKGSRAACKAQAFEQYKHREFQRFAHVTLGKFVLIFGSHHPLHFKNSGNIYLLNLS